MIDVIIDIIIIHTWTIRPSSTMELFAVKFAEVFKAPLKTTKLAPVNLLSYITVKGLCEHLILNISSKQTLLHILMAWVW